MNYLDINYPGLKLTRRSEFSKLNKEYIFPFLDEEEIIKEYKKCKEYEDIMFSKKDDVTFINIDKINDLNIKYLFIPKYVDTTYLFEKKPSEPLNIKSIFIPENINSFCFHNLRNSEIKFIYIPPTVKSMFDYTFENSKLEQIVIDTSFNKIPSSFCEGCKNLFYMKISNNNIRGIDKYAFKNTSLKYVEIPSNIKYINYKAFISPCLEEVIINNIDNLMLAEDAFNSDMEINVRIKCTDKEKANEWINKNKDAFSNKCKFTIEVETLEDIIKSQKDKTKIIDTNHEEILSI